MYGRQALIKEKEKYSYFDLFVVGGGAGGLKRFNFVSHSFCKITVGGQAKFIYFFYIISLKKRIIGNLSIQNKKKGKNKRGSYNFFKINMYL